MQQAVP